MMPGRMQKALAGHQAVDETLSLAPGFQSQETLRHGVTPAR